MKRLIAFAMLCVAFSAVHAVEILRWERVPLAVSLLVDQERVILLDRSVRVGMPALLGEQLRVQSAGGALYLRASAPFDATRIQLQDIETGTLILLDVSARLPDPEQKPLEPVRVVDAGTVASSDAERDDETHRSRTQNSAPTRATPVPVVLTRYAAQSLYAPLRTVEAVPGIARVGLPRTLSLATLMPSLPVEPRALAAWKLDGYWLTAIALKNTSGSKVELDPRVLQGDFVAVTFQHADLGPAGDPTDTTVLYLVTRGHGLGESLLPAISPIDAAVNLPHSPTRSGGRDEK